MKASAPKRLLWLLGLLAGLQSGAAWAEEAATRPQYLRVLRDEADEPLALETAVVHFVAKPDASGKPATDVSVDLIGAVHVGDKAYYETLNKLFEQYDVVLYELVAPEGTRVPKGSKPSGHPVAMLQNGIKDLLALEHQLEQIDYTKENLLHADMSPEDLEKAMKDRNENFMTMFFRMMGQAMAQDALNRGQPQGKKGKAKSSDMDLFSAMFSKDRASAMKRVMAEQFATMDGMFDMLGGPQGSALITDRNQVALTKAGEQIAAGKKRIAIFYGAGHMNDMEKHLIDDLKLQRDSEAWLTAWKLTKPKSESTPPKSDKGPGDTQPDESQPDGGSGKAKKAA